MSHLTILHQRHAAARPITLPAPDLASVTGWDVPGHRNRIWDLSPNLHCSIVGTCLSTAELRQLFAKLDNADARSASDHALHGRAVRAAGQRDVAGKLLNKMLDKRHETHVKRSAKAKTVEQVRELWKAALESGDIPGAYWAVLTHPATDDRLVQEAFGDVHMLSHLVGMANRADICRLRHLERQQGEQHEKIQRQETRLRVMAQERNDLRRRVEALEAQLQSRPVSRSPIEDEQLRLAAAAARQRADDLQTRAHVLEARLQEHIRAADAKDDRVRLLEEQLAVRENELASLEAALADPSTGDVGTPRMPDLDARRLLYVGGRPRQVEQLRVLVARFGGQLLAHDGGLEDNTGLLPGLVSQCDVALFPVECVSHHAAGRVKRLCREAGKPFVPIRSASVASFLAAIHPHAKAATAMDGSRPSSG